MQKQCAGIAGYHGEAGPRVQPRCLRTVRAVCSLALMTCAVSVVADEAGYTTRTDTILLSANRAEQAPDHRSFAFSGEFLLSSTEWRIDSNTAVIRGRLEKPDMIELAGQPARITVLRDGDSRPLVGHSARLRFDPAAEILDLTGTAMIVRDRQSISSDSIRYLLERDTFSAGDGGRVRVVTTPKRD